MCDVIAETHRSCVWRASLCRGRARLCTVLKSHWSQLYVICFFFEADEPEEPEPELLEAPAALFEDELELEPEDAAAPVAAAVVVAAAPEDDDDDDDDDEEEEDDDGSESAAAEASEAATAAATC